MYIYCTCRYIYIYIYSLYIIHILNIQYMLVNIIRHPHVLSIVSWSTVRSELRAKWQCSWWQRKRANCSAGWSWYLSTWVPNTQRVSILIYIYICIWEIYTLVIWYIDGMCSYVSDDGWYVVMDDMFMMIDLICLCITRGILNHQLLGKRSPPTEPPNPLPTIPCKTT